MEIVDRARHTGNHHDPPTANHTADAATATNAKTATGRYGAPMKPLIRHHAFDLTGDSTLLSGVAIVSALLFIAIDACPSPHYPSPGAGAVPELV
jgi:hypothetical protein